MGEKAAAGSPAELVDWGYSLSEWEGLLGTIFSQHILKVLNYPAVPSGSEMGK